MRKTVIVEASRLPGPLLPAVPIRLAQLARNLGAEQAALVARASSAVTAYGALEVIPSPGEGVVRRHSGGPTARVEAGDYYLAIVDSRGFTALAGEAVALTGARGGVFQHGVVAVGATSGYGYVEVYTARDPHRLLEAFAPGEWEYSDLDVELLEEPASTLASHDWLDPLTGEVEVEHSMTSEQGFRLRLVGTVDPDSGIILETFPDHTIYAYPPGHARMVFREISSIPPADPVAVHTMNALFGGAVVYGAKATEILEVVRGYLERASETIAKVR